MVSIMVQWTDANDGGKIASYPCKEADVEQIVADFEAEYGAVKQISLDDGVVYGRKGNKKYGFRLFADKHELIIRTTEAQMERLMDTIVTDEFEKHFVSEGYGYIETLFDRKTEGSETMTENCGYDRDFVLLETGEFEVDGETFTYEGEPITVGDVLDHKIQMIDFNVTKEGYKGCFILMETGHILCRVSHYNRHLRHLFSTDEIVYAPTFSEIYPTASDFIESRIELLQRFQPTKEFQEKVDYCSYKGRLFKDLVKMSNEELEVIDNEEASAEISMSDVEAYVEWLIGEGQNPKNWVKDLVITADHIDYLVRSRIGRGIDKCEKYCSPSVDFFRLADRVYMLSKAVQSDSQEDDEDENMKKLSEICNKVRRLGATETTIAFNPVHNEDGSSDAKIYYSDGTQNEMFNECFDVTVKTIGELEYLKENLPNVVSDSATTFWDNPSLLFCNGFVIQDKEFQMVDGLILYCKIEGKKLYYRTYESGEWNEIKEESLEELKLEASKHPLGKWRYTGLGGTLGKMLYALTYHSTDIKMAVMSGYDSIYCEGTSLTGDTFQLRY